MTRNSLAIPRLPIRRPRRQGEWTEQKAVTFIVTLAARGNVTLAARNVGMSRKAAYALRARDAGFARAWNSALEARRPERRDGDKVDELRDPPLAPPNGDSVALRALGARRRDLFFASPANRSELRRAASSQ